jgi:hypothetical protein
VSGVFPVQNGLKQGDASSSLLFNFALEYAIRETEKKSGRTGTEWNTSAPGLCYNVNILGIKYKYYKQKPRSSVERLVERLV